MTNFESTRRHWNPGGGSRRALLQSTIAAAGGFLVVHGGIQSLSSIVRAQEDDNGGGESGGGRGRGRGRGGDHVEEVEHVDRPDSTQDNSLLATGEVPAGSLEVRIVSEDAGGFVPGDLTVDVGQTVTFVNQSDDEHTATGSGFDTGEIDRGGVVTMTLNEPGRFPYACQFHPVMTGSIAVRNAEGIVPERAVAVAPSDAMDVSIVDLSYDPPRLDVQTGGTVGWTNDDAVPHTVTAADGSFDSGILDPGAGFIWTFSRPGSFAYTCQLHPQMQATVAVSGEPVAASSTTDDTSASLQAATPADEQVSIVEFAFEAPTISVPAGATITWTNNGSAPHTVTGDFADSGVIEPGATFTHAFDAEGVFAYVCAFHPNMTGQINVGPREATTSAMSGAEPPTALPVAGTWLLQLLPEDEALLGQQRALVLFDADGTIQIDLAPVNQSDAQSVTRGGLGTWVERDSGIELAIAMLTVDDSGRFAGHMTIAGTVSHDSGSDRLNGSFTFRLISTAGYRVGEGSGSIAGESILLDP